MSINNNNNDNSPNTNPRWKSFKDKFKECARGFLNSFRFSPEPKRAPLNRGKAEARIRVAVASTAVLGTQGPPSFHDVTVTRVGVVCRDGLHYSGAMVLSTGDEVLREYLRNCVSFIEDDDGKMWPIKDIIYVSITTTRDEVLV